MAFSIFKFFRAHSHVDKFTKQPPAKAGGFELRTESPDTRRLNDASYSGSILKLSFGFGIKMMLQVSFDHLFCHLAYCRTKMPSPVPLLQVRKFFKQIARCPPFYPPHDLARSHLRRTTHQNMHMILAYYSLYNSDFKCFSLPRLLSIIRLKPPASAG